MDRKFHADLATLAQSPARSLARSLARRETTPDRRPFARVPRRPRLVPADSNRREPRGRTGALLPYGRRLQQGGKTPDADDTGRLKPANAISLNLAASLIDTVNVPAAAAAAAAAVAEAGGRDAEGGSTSRRRYAPKWIVSVSVGTATLWCTRDGYCPDGHTDTYPTDRPTAFEVRVLQCCSDTQQTTYTV